MTGLAGCGTGIGDTNQAMSEGNRMCLCVQATSGLEQPKAKRPATRKRKQPETQVAADTLQSEPQDPANAQLPPATPEEGKQTGKQGGRRHKGTSAGAQAAAEAADASPRVTTRSRAASGDSKSRTPSERAAAQGPAPAPASEAGTAGSDEEQDIGEDAGDAEVPEGVPCEEGDSGALALSP